MQFPLYSIYLIATVVSISVPLAPMQISIEHVAILEFHISSCLVSFSRQQEKGKNPFPGFPPIFFLPFPCLVGVKLQWKKTGMEDHSSLCAGSVVA